jgi:transcriptional regulator with XRE-family HTH domain
MRTLSNDERMNLSNGKALRRAREHLKVTRDELARRLELSPKSVEKYENGRAVLDEEKVFRILSVLGIGMNEFLRAKKGRPLYPPKKREKLVVENSHRRSYQKLITKEVKVLRTLRNLRGFSQDQASSVCGYSRPSIGHIENGRIELNKERINHIVSNYGFALSEYERMMNEDVLRDEILEKCFEKMKLLSEEKLRIIQSLLMTM